MSHAGTAQKIESGAPGRTITPEMFAELVDTVSDIAIILNNTNRDPRVEDARKRLKAMSAAIRPAPAAPSPPPPDKVWVPPWHQIREPVLVIDIPG